MMVMMIMMEVIEDNGKKNVRAQLRPSFVARAGRSCRCCPGRVRVPSGEWQTGQLLEPVILHLETDKLSHRVSVKLAIQLN